MIDTEAAACSQVSNYSTASGHATHTHMHTTLPPPDCIRTRDLYRFRNHLSELSCRGGGEVTEGLFLPFPAVCQSPAAVLPPRGLLSHPPTHSGLNPQFSTLPRPKRSADTKGGFVVVFCFCFLCFFHSPCGQSERDNMIPLGTALIFHTLTFLLFSSPTPPFCLFPFPPRKAAISNLSYFNNGRR